MCIPWNIFLALFDFNCSIISIISKTHKSKRLLSSLRLWHVPLHVFQVQSVCSFDMHHYMYLVCRTCVILTCTITCIPHSEHVWFWHVPLPVSRVQNVCGFHMYHYMYPRFRMCLVFERYLIPDSECMLLWKVQGMKAWFWQ